MQIKGKLEGEIDVKRFYLHGMVFEDDCPTCGRLCSFGGSSDYLSYPVANEPIDFSFYCRDCDEEGREPMEWSKKIILVVDVVSVKTDTPE